jgi:hypothetical protein
MTSRFGSWHRQVRQMLLHGSQVLWIHKACLTVIEYLQSTKKVVKGTRLECENMDKEVDNDLAR